MKGKGALEDVGALEGVGAPEDVGAFDGDGVVEDVFHCVSLPGLHSATCAPEIEEFEKDPLCNATLQIIKKKYYSLFFISEELRCTVGVFQFC